MKMMFEFTKNRIEAEEPLPHAVHDRRHRHCRPGMSRPRRLDGIHGECPNRRDGETIELFAAHIHTHSYPSASGS